MKHRFTIKELKELSDPQCNDPDMDWALSIRPSWANRLFGGSLGRWKAGERIMSLTSLAEGNLLVSVSYWPNLNGELVIAKNIVKIKDIRPLLLGRQNAVYGNFLKNDGKLSSYPQFAIYPSNLKYGLGIFGKSDAGLFRAVVDRDTRKL